MKQLITDTQIFKKELRLVETLINPGKAIPEQVFDTRLSNFRFISLDDMFSEKFFEKLKDYLREIHEHDVRVLVIDPDPELYFYNNFGKYPLLVLSLDVTAKEFVDLVFADPGASPADAIAYNSSTLLIYSSSLQWAIYGSRDFEIGIFASEKTVLSMMFRKIYNQSLNVYSAIDVILEPAWGNEFPNGLRTKLLANYSCQ